MNWYLCLKDDSARLKYNSGTIYAAVFGKNVKKS